MAVSDRYVLLKGGLALPVEPILLALQLEERGFSLRNEGETLIVPTGRCADVGRPPVHPPLEIPSDRGHRA